jgi:hypothetical protein
MGVRDKKRFEEIKFQTLCLAVAKSEVRFKEVLKLAKDLGPVSRKTVAKYLALMGEEGLIKGGISKKTHRNVYRPTAKGMGWCFNKELLNSRDKFLAEAQLKAENVSTEDLIDFLEGLSFGFLMNFLDILIKVRENVSERVEQIAYSMVNGGKLKREDANFIIDKVVSVEARKDFSAIAESYAKNFVDTVTEIGRELIPRRDIVEKAYPHILTRRKKLQSLGMRIAELLEKEPVLKKEFPVIPKILATLEEDRLSKK